jgi:amino acid transporter
MADSGGIVELKRQLTLLDGVGIIIGGMIGSGIFVSPVGIIRHVLSPGMSLVVWLLLGLVSTGGCLCYAELGTTFKVSGGEFMYIKKGLGDIPGYIYLLITLFLNLAAGMVVSGLVLATYLLRPLFISCDPPDKAVLLITVLVVCKYPASIFDLINQTLSVRTPI